MSKVSPQYDLIIIGGGAAGFFTSIIASEMNPSLKVLILERGKDVLQKVRISGGGRCNVTHACFDPKDLSKNYPRGEKELLGPFHQFNCQDTINWFKEKEVTLKTETDGRIFPVTDNSETIAQCLIQSANKAGVKVLTSHRVESVSKNDNTWNLKTNQGSFSSSLLFLGAGSSDAMWDVVRNLGHTIIPPVPSLFTFNIKDSVLNDMGGISVNNVSATIQVSEQKKELLKTNGPLLITHWGFSGPAILKLSAWGARILNQKKYQFDLYINWVYPMSLNEVQLHFEKLKMKEWAKKQVVATSPFSQIPLRLWKYLSKTAIQNGMEKNWADLSKKEISLLSETLANNFFKVTGKSTFKEEFVTAGGVSLKEINLKTFESKIVPGLYMAGEILDIDAVTGGFNFQAAWTGGFLAGSSIGSLTL